MRRLLMIHWMLLAAGFISPGCFPASAGQAAAPAGLPESAATEYLGDYPELILVTRQDFGELGWNVAAHASDKAGLPLQIGEKTYAKGLGHHANGLIQVPLDGQYAGFDAEVGIQPCGGGGSVIFRVFVDGKLRFDSGIMRGTSAAKAVHVDLAGAEELRLEVNDAGDGISCDVADWAEARLTRANVAGRPEPEPPMDIARFGRVVTWDPNRNDGARASRIEEFRAEDVYLETNVPLNPDGSYRLAVSTNGLGCIGVQWLNRRALKEVALEFMAGTQIPPTNAVQVQGWFGESAWQGAWKPLAGELRATGNRLVFRLSSQAGVVQTQKIRWVFPAGGQTVVRGVSAFTRWRWQTVSLRVEAEKPAKGARGATTVCNGELLAHAIDPRGEAGQRLDPLKWDLRTPVALTVRCTRSS
jgi:hypothetical protein